jgi:DNA-binding response OmpR family regulator
MPEIDGLELFERVKAREKDLVTIFITGHGTLDTAIDSLVRGVDGFLLKPFTQEELLGAVDRAISSSRLKKENIRLKALIPLFEISKLLVSEIDLAQLFKITTEVLVQEFSVDRVSLMLIEETSGTLLMRIPRPSRGSRAEVPTQRGRRRLRAGTEAWESADHICRETS